MLGRSSCPKDDTLRMAHTGRERERKHTSKITNGQNLSN
jgi:hypothetical protein